MTSDIVTQALPENEPNLAQPWAAHRKRTYLLLTAVTGIAFVLAVAGVGLRVSAAELHRRRHRQLGVRRAGDPATAGLFLDGPGRTPPRLERAAELTLIYLPYTAGSQLGYGPSS